MQPLRALSDLALSGLVLSAASGGGHNQPLARRAVQGPLAASFAMPRTFGAAWVPITVTDFGAKGDGQANDGPAIQAAIDAALSDGSLCVWFPPGDYVTHQTILASGSADRPTKSPVSLRGRGTAANTRILLRLSRPALPRPALPTAVIKFQGSSMGAGASICHDYAGGFCAGAGVFSHTIVENLNIDANVTGDPLSNNTVGIEWAAVVGGIARNCAIGLTGLEVRVDVRYWCSLRFLHTTKRVTVCCRLLGYTYSSLCARVRSVCSCIIMRTVRTQNFVRLTTQCLEASQPCST